MAANPVTEGINFSNRYVGENLCIRPIVLDICTRYQASRIFCVRCGNRNLNSGGQDAGCAVAMQCSANGIAHSIEWTWENQARQKRLGGPAKMEGSSVDIVVHTDIDDLHLKVSELIESATGRLRPNGILMIALPFAAFGRRCGSLCVSGGTTGTGDILNSGRGNG